MERALTYNEKNKINQICKTENSIVISYGNIAKIIAPIFTILFFLFLYFEISWGSFYVYIGIGILLSIVEITGITYVQTPYLAIKNDNCSCIETKMLSKQKVLRKDHRNLIPHSVLEKTVRPGEVRYYNYYVDVNIEGKVKKVEYRGKEFECLNVGEEMLIIQFINRKKDNRYICFSYKEING